ncbi:retinol-binding protein pinta [Diachasma alloeum]|uniref:retinol-binding protein pinta n=1 Tax=Diachasma alloeum TaxID=454923 RepID=UPI0007381015|nr:retinol-binding protein pinta [Diachasma alloeum]
MSIRALPAELKKVAKKELKEDEKRIVEHVKYITEWLEKQPHINARTDPQWLVAFLRGCKYSLERTKEKLDSFYTVRTHLPEIFLKRDLEETMIQEVLDLGIYLPLPEPVSADGPRVILMRPCQFDAKKYTYSDILKVSFMIMDFLLLKDDRLNVAGQISVLDLTGSKLEHASQFTPSLVKKTVMAFQDGYPMKTKSLHFVNPPPTFDVLFSVFKNFMNKKLKDRIMVHKDPEDVFDYIPREVLPSDYGGQAPSIAALTHQWKNAVLEHRDWYQEDSKHRVDESKRPDKAITSLDLFGMEGSFKKLEFD